VENDGWFVGVGGLITGKFKNIQINIFQNKFFSKSLVGTSILDSMTPVIIEIMDGSFILIYSCFE
jgi:hypothetical protein